jgi:sugar phosphate isomerase/epimerase
MRLSFAITLQPTRFEAIGEGDWREMAGELSRLGYDGIEIGVRDPVSVDVREIEEVLNTEGLRLSAIGSGQSYVDDGLSISSPNEKIRERATIRLKRCIDIAKVFDAQVIIGLIRGDREAQREELFRNLTNSLRQILDYAALKDVVVTIEPINRGETSLLNRADEVVRFIEGFGCENLKMMLDTFHMEIEEEDPIVSIRMSRRYLSHLHLADTNRGSPGEGEIDFRKIIEELKRIGYKGFLSAEVVPSPSFEVCARKWIEKIRSYL